MVAVKARPRQAGTGQSMGVPAKGFRTRRNKRTSA